MGIGNICRFRTQTNSRGRAFLSPRSDCHWAVTLSSCGNRKPTWFCCLFGATFLQVTRSTISNMQIPAVSIHIACLEFVSDVSRIVQSNFRRTIHSASATLKIVAQQYPLYIEKIFLSFRWCWIDYIDTKNGKVYMAGERQNIQNRFWQKQEVGG